MTSSESFWNKHWREHFVLLALIFLIGLLLLLCRDCHDLSVAETLPRRDIPTDTQVSNPVSPDAEVVVEDPMNEAELGDIVEQEGGHCGALCVQLGWRSVDDLDLIVQQPGGNTISIYRDNSRVDFITGAELDVDANVGASGWKSPAAENITWSEPARGEYIIKVNLYQQNSLLATVPFTLMVKEKNGRSQTFTGKVSSQGRVQSFRISYPL